MKTQSPDTSPDDMKWNDDLSGNEFRIADLGEREARIRRAFLPPSIEYDSPEYWAHLRSMTKAERMRQSFEMSEMMFEDVRAEIKAEHPQWSEREQKIEFVARMYGPILAEHFQRHVKAKGIYVHSH